MKNKILLLSMPLVASSLLFAETGEEKGGLSSFSVSGAVEFEANAHYKQIDPRNETYNSQSDKIFHDYSSTFDLLFQVKFSDKWSADAAISADNTESAPGFAYDGAFVRYDASENLAFKVGDMTYSEGAFRYYDYDDPGDAAVGMAERNIRGLELDFHGLTVGIGFGTDDDDEYTTYDAHVAYDLELSGQTIRPYFNYKSYQTEDHNSMRTGVAANLVFGDKINVSAVYGLFSDFLGEDSPKMSHAFAVEPEVTLGKLTLKGTAFYAILDEEAPTAIDVPEYMFFYVEPVVSLCGSVAQGLPAEYHTMTLDSDAKLGQIFVGPKAYVNPTETLYVEAYARAFFPVGDDYDSMDSDDPYFGAGATAGFTF